jgi:co-chaperonin GroES (HSP10)
VKVKPIGDAIAIQLLDEVDAGLGAGTDIIGASSQEAIGDNPVDGDYDKLVLAQIVGVGDGDTIKEKKLKVGLVVLCRAYAADGAKIDEDTILADAWCVTAIVTE